jgi:hypothetical protein
MNDRCFWHGDEPIPEGAFKVCAECWHCWPTKAAFVADVQAMSRETGAGDYPYDLADLPFCPLCAHDF